MNQWWHCLNHLPLQCSAAYMRQWSGSTLIQVMACRLFGAKPLHDSMLVYCQLDSREQLSVKFESEFYHLLTRKCIWNCRLPQWRPSCPGKDESKIGTRRWTKWPPFWSRFKCPSCTMMFHILPEFFFLTEHLLTMSCPHWGNLICLMNSC